jgi:hypothetical protein
MDSLNLTRKGFLWKEYEKRKRSQKKKNLWKSQTMMKMRKKNKTNKKKKKKGLRPMNRKGRKGSGL